VLHALAISVAFGGVFMLAVLGGGCSARLAVAVRYRSGHARHWLALSARGRSVLRLVRAGSGTLLRVTGGQAAALAAPRKPDAIGDGGRCRLAGAALERRPDVCLPRLECGAGRLRPD
jgi:hypothetical protein